MSEQNTGTAPVESAVSPETSSNESEAASSEEGQAAAPAVSADAVAALKDQAENGTAKEKAAAKKTLKSLKIKVDGKELEESLPFEIDEDDAATRDWLTKKLQLSSVAQKRMQSEHQLQKDAQEFFELLKTNPKKVLADPNIGIDLKKFAAEIINEEFERSQKSPEQLKLEAAQQELEEIRAQRKKEKEDFDNSEKQRLQVEAERNLDEEITSVLTGSTLPKSPYVVKRMASMMMDALNNGLDLGAKDVLPYVKAEIEGEIKEMFGAMPEEIMEQLLGKDNISRLRKRSIAKAKQNQAVETASQIKSTGADVKKKEAEAPKKIPLKDFLKMS